MPLFHSVSSFNNAGFALYTDNLIGFVSDPWICLPIAGAIILGGLGFPVIMQLRKEFTRPLHWTMNTKLVLTGTVDPARRRHRLHHRHRVEQPGDARRARSRGPRAGGLLPVGADAHGGIQLARHRPLNDETWLGMDVLMFIGGGPAGTAGGIKVTTFAVLFFIMMTELRGEGAVNIFGKRLSRAVHRQAITVVLIAVAAVVVATALLMIITGLDLDRLLFEAVSAFGTVGLSTGITPGLPDAAKVILVLLMFLGRLGPLTLGTALALRERRILYEYPKERPAIG